MHVAIRGRNPPIPHHIGDLMKRLRQPSPEIPIIVSAPHVGPRISFDRVIKVGKLQRVAEEKYRSIVAHHVPVALLGIKLQSVSANITLCVGRAPLPRHRREPRKQGRALTDLGKQFGFRVASDVVGDDELTKCPRPLCMHATLRDDFAVKMRELFQEPYVLQQHWAAAASSHGVLVFRNRGAGNGCKFRLISHGCNSLVFTGFQCLDEHSLVECHHRKPAQRRPMMKVNAANRANLSGIELSGSGRRRPHGRRPPTPPCVRFRTRRFRPCG